MASYDIHTNLKQEVAKNIGAISSNTTTNGNIIDTRYFEAVEFIIQSGTITDGTFTPQIQEGDQADLSDAATVSSDFIIGATSDATFVAADDNKAKRIGYVGKKRFVRLNLVSTGVSSGGTFGAIAVLGHPRNMPTAA